MQSMKQGSSILISSQDHLENNLGAFSKATCEAPSETISTFLDMIFLWCKIFYQIRYLYQMRICQRNQRSFYPPFQAKIYSLSSAAPLFVGYPNIFQIQSPQENSFIFPQNNFEACHYFSEEEYSLKFLFQYSKQYNKQFNKRMSSSLYMENPEPFLLELQGKMIGVQLKWGWQLRGILQSKDEYMNLLLANAEEIVNGEKKGELGQILIRCNNILYIREITE